MDELSLSDLKCIEPHVKLLTSSLATVNASVVNTLGKLNALHLELARRPIKT